MRLSYCYLQPLWVGRELQLEMDLTANYYNGWMWRGTPTSCVFFFVIANTKNTTRATDTAGSYNRYKDAELRKGSYGTNCSCIVHQYSSNTY